MIIAKNTHAVRYGMLPAHFIPREGDVLAGAPEWLRPKVVIEDCRGRWAVLLPDHSTLFVGELEFQALFEPL